MTDESKKKDTLFDQCRRQMFVKGFLFPAGGFPETIKFLCERIERQDERIAELKRTVDGLAFPFSVGQER